MTSSSPQQPTMFSKRIRDLETEVAALKTKVKKEEEIRKRQEEEIALLKEKAEEDAQWKLTVRSWILQAFGMMYFILNDLVICMNNS